MSTLKESPDHARQLLAAIARELARASKRKAVYLAEHRSDAVARLTRRMAMLARLRDDALLRVDPSARIIGPAHADGTSSAFVSSPNAVVSSPNGPRRTALGSIEFPAMTADGPVDEDDLLEGLV